jgi:hypothetical protein
MNPHGKCQTAGGACFCGQGALQDVSDFLLHGQAMARSAQTQAGFELIVQISNGDAAHFAPLNLIVMIAMMAL